MIAADEAEIIVAAKRIKSVGATVVAVEADLATPEGVEKLYGALGGRPWMPCSPMQVAVSARDFLIRTLTT